MNEIFLKNENSLSNITYTNNTFVAVGERGTILQSGKVSNYIPVTDKESGDLNADGRTTLADAILGLQITIGNTDLEGEGYAYADVNGDGKINMAEVVYIMQNLIRN